MEPVEAMVGRNIPGFADALPAIMVEAQTAAVASARASRTFVVVVITVVL